MLSYLIQLRDVMTEDLEIFFENLQDQETTRSEDFPAREKDDFIANWNRILANPAIIKKTVIYDGKVKGSIMCYEKSGKHVVSYCIGNDYWGERIAAGALITLLEQVNHRPLYAYVNYHNITSVHVLEKCGFTVRNRSDTEFMLELRGRETRFQSLH